MTNKHRALILASLVCVAAAVLAAIGVRGAGAAASAVSDHKVKIAFAGDSIVDNYWSGAEKIVAVDAVSEWHDRTGAFCEKRDRPRRAATVSIGRAKSGALSKHSSQPLWCCRLG